MNTQDHNLNMSRILTEYNIRPTTIRKNIAGLLFDGTDRHVSVDDVIEMAHAANVKTSVASVYNTLNRFALAGLLRRVSVDLGRMFFDTNLSEHHHFYYENEGRLEDIPHGLIKVSGLPKLPKGRAVKSINVMVWL
ncbi:MAG: transcriptional repressor [Robiginitomaculum sp.]|nr:transcriptional repressor [Robiginitomaculum sp.]